MKRANRPCLRKKEGYTLLELLVSLSILALLTVTLLGTGFNSRNAFSNSAYDAELVVLQEKMAKTVGGTA